MNRIYLDMDTEDEHAGGTRERQGKFPSQMLACTSLADTKQSYLHLVAQSGPDFLIGIHRNARNNDAWH